MYTQRIIDGLERMMLFMKLKARGREDKKNSK